MCEDGSVIDNDSLKSEYCKDVEQSIGKLYGVSSPRQLMNMTLSKKGTV